VQTRSFVYITDWWRHLRAESNIQLVCTRERR